jgi:hypothetical protein
MRNLHPAPPSAPRPVATDMEAQKLIENLARTMDALLAIVEEETEFVRAGRIDQVAELERRKAELASSYYGATERIKANTTFLKASLPRELDALRRQHEMFRSLLQINLTVLATAHAVSEDIIRGVAGEMNRKAAPQTYGQSGRQTAPRTNAAPVTLSRTL